MWVFQKHVGGDAKQLIKFHRLNSVLIVLMYTMFERS